MRGESEPTHNKCRTSISCKSECPQTLIPTLAHAPRSTDRSNASITPSPTRFTRSLTHSYRQSRKDRNTDRMTAASGKRWGAAQHRGGGIDPGEVPPCAQRSLGPLLRSGPRGSKWAAGSTSSSPTARSSSVCVWLRRRLSQLEETNERDPGIHSFIPLAHSFLSHSFIPLVLSLSFSP